MSLIVVDLLPQAEPLVIGRIDIREEVDRLALRLEKLLVKELEEYGVIRGEKRDGETLYDDTVRESLVDAGAGEYVVVGVGGVAPLLQVEATSEDPDQALRTVAMVTAALERELEGQQTLSGADEAAFISSRV